MEEEMRDFVEFEDEQGNKLELDIISYFVYEDEEYAILADLSCFRDMTEEEALAADDNMEFFILKIVSDGETEEFVNPDEDKMEALSALAEDILNGECECGCGDDDCDCDCDDDCDCDGEHKDDGCKCGHCH